MSFVECVEKHGAKLAVPRTVVGGLGAGQGRAEGPALLCLLGAYLHEHLIMCPVHPCAQQCPLSVILIP